MKVTVSPAGLAAILAVAAKACGRAAIHPHLPYVLLEAGEDGMLAATGTDLRVRARHAAPALVSEPGAVCLPPGALADFLDAVPAAAAIDLAVDGAHKALLAAGRTTARVAGLAPDEYPAGAPAGAPAAELLLEPEAFGALVRATAHAAAKDETRPALAGVHLETAGETLVLTASNGISLARRVLSLGGPAPALDLIVPAGPLADVAAAAAGTKAPLTLAVDSRVRVLRIASEAGTWSLTLIDGRYPSTGAILELPAPSVITVAQAELERACRLVAGVLVAITGTDGKTSSRISKAVLEPGEGCLTVRAGDVSADHMAEAVLDAECGPDTYTFALNGAALAAAAGALDGPVLRLELCGPGKPVFLCDAGAPDRAGHCQMVLPMAVSNLAQRTAA